MIELYRGKIVFKKVGFAKKRGDRLVSVAFLYLSAGYQLLIFSR